MYGHLEMIPAQDQDSLDNVSQSIHQSVMVSISITPKLSDPKAVQVLRNELQEALLPLSVKGWDVRVWTGPVEE